MQERLGSDGLRRTLTLTLVMLGSIIWLKPVSVSATESPWLSGQPQIQIEPNQYPVQAPNFNQDCVPETGLRRRASSPLFGQQAEALAVEGCAIYVPYGRFMGSYVQIGNSGLYGSMQDSVMPIAGSHTVWKKHQGTPYLGSAYLLPRYTSRLTLRHHQDGQFHYELDVADPVFLRHEDGHLLTFDYASASSSQNGQWLVAIADQRLARINLVTHQILLFDTPQYVGENLRAQTAVTNDGRYLALAIASLNRFRIYDLADCNPTGDCRHHDIPLPPPAQNGTEHVALRFLSGYTLSFYRRDQVYAATTWSRIILTAAGQEAARYEYLALGDSFASGEGAYGYRVGTNNISNTCRLSSYSYPYLLQGALSLNTVGSVACSGATIAHMNAYSPYTSLIPLTSVLSRLLPGYVPQAHFQAYYRAHALTLSVGGNDIGFGRKLLRCLEPDTCYSSYEDRVEIVREINSKFDQLAAAYRSLREISLPDTRIYVIGYPEILKSGGNCGANVRLNASEIEFSNLAIRYLNQVIALAARKAGVFYVDSSNAFTGHRLCEAAEGQLAVNGLTAGDNHLGLFASESYHPNRLGHQRLSRLVQDATAGLSAPMPPTDDTVTTPPENDSLPLLQAPRTGRPIYHINYDDDLSNNVVVRGGVWAVVVDASKLLFRPFSWVRAVLHSEPLELGSFRTDSVGGLRSGLRLPHTVKAGYHTLHLYGENWAGESVDIYKIIYVSDDAPRAPTVTQMDIPLPPAGVSMLGALSNSHREPLGREQVASSAKFYHTPSYSPLLPSAIAILLVLAPHGGRGLRQQIRSPTPRR